jgi:hypothetical protein
LSKNPGDPVPRDRRSEEKFTISSLTFDDQRRSSDVKNFRASSRGSEETHANDAIGLHRDDGPIADPSLSLPLHGQRDTWLTHGGASA